MKKFRDLDEVLTYLSGIDKKALEKWVALGEGRAVASIHFNGGMSLRNELGLWGKNELTDWFNKQGIFHADDMSGIIYTSLHRKLSGKEIKLPEQIAFYIAYWKQWEKVTINEEK